MRSWELKGLRITNQIFGVKEVIEINGAQEVYKGI